MREITSKFMYVLYLLWIPFWYLQILFPRKKNVWVFGAWYGVKYSDNSKVLFEYICNNHPEIDAIWLTRDSEIRNSVLKTGRKCELTNSLTGVYLSLRASFIIISSGKIDVNPFFINGAKVVNLWHGSPLKKIGLDDKFVTFKFKNIILRYLFPFLYEFNIDYVVNSGDIFTDKLARAFNIEPVNVLSSGFPRNDLLFSLNESKLVAELNVKYNNPLLIFYLPTFRNLTERFRPFDSYKFNEKKWLEFLTINNIVLISKGHFVDNVVGLNTEGSRIIHLSDNDIDDLYLVLKDTSILITDFSSIYFDYLLTNRPIIFAPFDFETYISTSRELYFDYHSVICGPCVYDWNDVLEAIQKILDNDTYIYDRINMNNKFNNYHDSLNSKRLFNRLIGLNV